MESLRTPVILVVGCVVVIKKQQGQFQRSQWNQNMFNMVTSLSQSLGELTPAPNSCKWVKRNPGG